VPAALGARRPLMAPGRGLSGFEFYVAESMIGRLRRREDLTAARACAGGVLAAMRLTCAQGLLALAELPGDWLAEVLAGQDILPGMLIALRADATTQDATALAALLAGLRQHGARVGWQAGAPGFAPGAQPDFLLLTASDDPRRATDAAGHRPELLVAPDLPDVERLEAFLEAGVALAGCSVGSPEPRQARELPPQTQPLLRLLNQLVGDTDHADVVATIKSDAALSVRLLQYLNSAGASPGRTLDSIDQAVLILGRAELYRWVARLTVRLGPPRPASAGLQQFALARAGLLELLARQAGEPQPGSLYLMGLASLLPALLQCRLDDALRTLALPEPAVLALAGGRGEWARYLAIALAVENGNLPEVERLAAHWGGAAAVMSLAERAWAASAA
jgi:EAL and modified HD-GYP domain-containing signal transduction protein